MFDFLKKFKNHQNLWWIRVFLNSTFLEFITHWDIMLWHGTSSVQSDIWSLYRYNCGSFKNDTYCMLHDIILACMYVLRTVYTMGWNLKKKLFAAIKPYGSAKGQRKNPYNVDFPAIPLIFNCIIFPFRIHFELM